MSMQDWVPIVFLGAQWKQQAPGTEQGNLVGAGGMESGPDRGREVINTERFTYPPVK